MAKKRKSKKIKEDKSLRHSLPSGFWAQVGAVIMIALAVLLVLAWFNTGGTVLHWIHTSLLSLFGYAVYVFPLALIYLAVLVFRDEDNKVPIVVVIASVLIILWFSGIFGLLKDSTNNETGGMVGSLLNKGMLSMVDEGVAAFIYILLIAITTLFVLSISPATVIKKVSSSLKSAKTSKENDRNAKIIKSADDSSANVKQTKANKELRLNAGVPVEAAGDKKKSLFNRNDSLSKLEKSADTGAALVAVGDPDWKMPSLDLLEKKQTPADAGNIQQNAEIIKNTLKEFHIDVEMDSANIGPRVTQYTLRPPSGVKLTRITALENNIALNLAAQQSIRIEAPIPGQKAVGIEVPNVRSADVRLYGVLNSQEWKRSSDKLSFAIGQDLSGRAVVEELNDMPHLLIAGQTGSGKSVMTNTLLCSLLYQNSPSDLKIILVDPKQVEMAQYDGIPHLLTPIITEPEKAASALKWAVKEMDRRYTLLASEKTKNISSYNRKIAGGRKISVADEAGNMQEHDNGKMPYIVIVIDELADLMMAAARDVEALIVRLAQKARAVGIHLVLATQRPSVDVITGLIKANIPARIAFTVASQVDSRTILDQVGAEKLLGKGDMLLQTPSMSKPKRVQGAWVTDDEVMRIADFLRLQSPPQYNPEVVAQPVQLNGKGGVVMDFAGESGDDMFNDAVKVVIDSKKASASLLQRRLRIGYGRASRLIDEMENQGLVGPMDGSRPREVLISSMDELEGNKPNF